MMVDLVAGALGWFTVAIIIGMGFGAFARLGREGGGRPGPRRVRPPHASQIPAVPPVRILR